MNPSRFWRLVSPDRLIAHNAVLAIGTVAAGVFGVGLQSLASHQLAPDEYGAAFAILTLVGLLSIPAGALTLGMARAASAGRVNATAADPRFALRRLSAWCNAGAVLLTAALLVAAPWISGYLHVDRSLVALGALGIPPAITLPLLVGYLQGCERFGAMATVLGGQAALKLLGVALLGASHNAAGILVGIVAGGYLSYLGAYLLTRSGGSPVAAGDLRPVLRYVARILPSMMALAVLFSADISLVRHLFPAAQAGLYAAVAALSRAIFWGATSIGSVLFPKAVRADQQGYRGLNLFAISVGLVAVVGLGGMAVLAPIGRFLLAAFAGARYQDGATYLGWYVLAMSLLGAASVAVTYHQSRDRQGFLYVLLPMTVGEVVLILLFHATLLQLIQVMDAALAALVLGLVAIALWPIDAPEPAAPQPVPSSLPVLSTPEA